MSDEKTVRAFVASVPGASIYEDGSTIYLYPPADTSWGVLSSEGGVTDVAPQVFARGWEKLARKLPRLVLLCSEEQQA